MTLAIRSQVQDDLTDIGTDTADEEQKRLPLGLRKTALAMAMSISSSSANTNAQTIKKQARLTVLLFLTFSNRS